MMRGERLTVLGLLGLMAIMGGLVAASVPLYRLFCRATGYGGTTERAAAAPAQALPGHLITVRFNAETAPDLPWDFEPVQRQVVVHPGQEEEIAYRAVNHSPLPITATATFNVTPDKAGIYFDKIQCFCFSAQHLDPGESAKLSVSFFVDPDIVKDPDTRDVDTITLSYTMFRSKTEAPAARLGAAASPSAARVN